MQSQTKMFLDFCRERPADETFDFGRSNACAFYQFAVAYGLPKPSRYSYEIPPHILDALVRSTNDQCIGTFGALADRLEAALSEVVS